MIISSYMISPILWPYIPSQLPPLSPKADACLDWGREKKNLSDKKKEDNFMDMRIKKLKTVLCIYKCMKCSKAS